MDQSTGITIETVLWIVVSVIGVIISWAIVGYPKWRVWAAHQEGLADLARANNEQQIQIVQARARAEAAELNKKAAIIEAEAVSETNLAHWTAANNPRPLLAMAVDQDDGRERNGQGDLRPDRSQPSYS